MGIQIYASCDDVIHREELDNLKQRVRISKKVVLVGDFKDILSNSKKKKNGDRVRSHSSIDDFRGSLKMSHM